MATIVVGWDGSEAADRALDFAARLAGRGDALVAVTVVPGRLQERSFLEMLLPTIDASQFVKPATFTDRARARLEERVKKADTAATLRVEVRSGDPADEIIGAVEHHKADHLVVGFKSYEKELRFDIGSVAEKLARYAPCAVTIVRWPGARDR